MMSVNRMDTAVMENLFSDILIRLNIPLASCHHFSENMIEALRILGDFSKHDRIQILEVRSDMTYRVVYEWYQKGLSGVPEKLKQHRVFYAEELERQLCMQNYMVIHETDDFCNPDWKEMLHEQQCRQMLLLPLYESGSQFAFIAFMQCVSLHEWSAKEIRMLEDIAAIISRQLDNYRITCRLLHRLRKEKKLKENMSILHSRLQHVHADLLPEWEQLKNRLSAYQDLKQEFVLGNMDKHIENLDRVCRKLVVK